MKLSATISMLLMGTSHAGLLAESSLNLNDNKQVSFHEDWYEVLHEEINTVLGNSPNEPCEPTELRSYVRELVEAIDPAALEQMENLDVFELSTFYNAFYRSEADPDEYFFVDGTRSEEITTLHEKNMEFWDIDSDDILLMGMHGAQLTIPNMLALYEFINEVDELGLTYQQIEGIVAHTFLLISQTIGFDHPLLSLNAFAFSTYGEDIFGTGEILQDRIVLGDGILQYLEVAGLGSDGPDFVLGHEFGHHIQFELDLFDNPPPGLSAPERTRRTELMADALSAYFLAHPLGDNFTADRLVEVYASGATVGDCSFNSTGHHGTPKQRERAAMWGADLVNKSIEVGEGQPLIFSTLSLVAQFDIALPEIINPYTFDPTSSPTDAPTGSPTAAPTTASPSSSPTHAPSVAPVTNAPSATPTMAPTTSAPTTASPTNFPTQAPVTTAPTFAPTGAPTASPTLSPTANPTGFPTQSPVTTAEANVCLARFESCSATEECCPGLRCRGRSSRNLRCR